MLPIVGVQEDSFGVSVWSACSSYYNRVASYFRLSPQEEAERARPQLEFEIGFRV